MVAYTKLQQREKEESEKLRRERSDLRFERWQVVRFRKQEEGKTFHKLHGLGMNDDLTKII